MGHRFSDLFIKSLGPDIVEICWQWSVKYARDVPNTDSTTEVYPRASKNHANCHTVRGQANVRLVAFLSSIQLVHLIKDECSSKQIDTNLILLRSSH